MAMFLELFCFGECTGISFIDSTCIPVCHNKRIKRNKVFKGYAELGKSTMGWFYGFKLLGTCGILLLRQEAGDKPGLLH